MNPVLQQSVDGVPCQYEKHPPTCPICHFSVQPIAVHRKIVSHDQNGVRMDVAYSCPRVECNRLFIACYKSKQEQPSEMFIHLELSGVLPTTPVPPEAHQEVKDLSPRFYEVYTQASFAESLGLSQICGIGYRKALEFLIKDFCISAHPDAEEQIKRTPLGGCITTYIDSPRIKKAAERAVWLGNDETHYVRTWADMDIHDLKVLIKLTMNWIQDHIITEHYETAMPRRSSAAH